MFNQIMAVLNRSHIFLFCSKKYAGELIGNVIFINADAEIIPTAIHEVLHNLNPGRNETFILRMERKLVKEFTVAQKRKILYTVVKRIRFAVRAKLPEREIVGCD